MQGAEKETFKEAPLVLMYATGRRDVPLGTLQRTRDGEALLTEDRKFSSEHVMFETLLKNQGNMRNRQQLNV